MSEFRVTITVVTFRSALRRSGTYTICGLLLGCSDLEQVSKVPSTGNSPMRCCADFARVMAVRDNAVALDIRTVTELDLPSRIANVFQPSGSKFLASYRCRFVLESTGGDHEQLSVGLYLVETREFAQYTQWKDLQIVPIDHLTDSASGAAGYGVFKYLRRNE